MNPVDTERTAFRTCPLCEATCGLAITLRGERVVRIAGDRDDVFSAGYLCPKGTTLGELHEDPDRLRTPLIKREGRWESATWDEAFSRVGELLRPIVREHGADAVAVYLGNPIGHNLSGLLYPRTFLKALGSRNLYTASTLDQRPKDLVNALLYGERYTLAVPDIDRTDLLVVLGANPVVSNGSLATAPGWPRRLQRLRERGGRLIVIDPVRTQTAEIADQHIRIRAGGDAALLMAVVHTLFDENRVRPGPLNAWLRNLDTLRQACRDWSPARVSGITGIAPEVIRQLARDIADAPSACVYGRMGTTTTAFGSLASWLVEAINILTGNLDRPGGAMFPLPATGSPNTRGRVRMGKGAQIGRWHTRVRQAPELFGEFPTVCLAEEMDTPGEGRYRAMIVVGGNPVSSAPNPARLDRALQGLDALVAIDPYLNETTRHAQVILPPPSPLQRSHYDVHFTQWSVRNVAKYSPAALPLQDGQLDEWQIMCRLASVLDGSGQTVEQVDDALMRAMVRTAVADEASPAHGRGIDEIVAALGPVAGPERLLDLLLRSGPYGDGFGARAQGLTLRRVMDTPHGVDLGALKPRLPEVLRTPDGLIDLAPEPLLGDLERLSGVLKTARPAGLRLIGRRHLRSNNSWMHNVPSLMTGRPRSRLWMNPDDARTRGLVSGERARVRSSAGAVDVTVDVNDRVPPGVVSLPHGWLDDAQQVRLSVADARQAANVNRLMSEADVDVPSWTAVLNGVDVDVDRINTPGDLP